MCGIAGFLLPQPASSRGEIEARAWAMIATLRHRGPDDEGVWTDGLAALAHARLSIIDLSPAGHQPIASADEQVWLTYNGEIYNFAELREELAAAGYVFKSRTDSEVIANGWHAWGPRLFGRLRGMFALALWDRRTRRLVLARDRVGKKPLFYAPPRQPGDAFLFGSEIKALLAWPGVARLPDLAAIDRYLTLQYVPGADTAFAGVKRLPPAHYLTIEADAGGRWRSAQPVRYWSLPEPEAKRATANQAELQRELVYRLEAAVRLRMTADVSLGAFLSGGVDSSAVVALMARAGTGPVRTFSTGSPSKAYDETRYARLVAERYGTRHEEFVVEPDAAAILPRLVWHFGEPFADPSAIPTWYVSQMARRHVTVALTGDGGDEAFLGYPRYQAMYWLDRLDRSPPPVRASLTRLCGLGAGALGRRLRLAKLADVLNAPAARPEQRYAGAISFFREPDKQAGYGEAMAERTSDAALDLLAPHFSETGSLLGGANRADIHTYLPDDLMAKVDIASMAHGLETRAPLLDHELLEWAARIPSAVKMPGGRLKGLFKAAMAPYLPAAILNRRKMGFGCPIDEWLRHELKELAHDTLLCATARQRGIVRPDYVARLLDEHSARRADHHTRLWALLMLELWFRTWIDGAAANDAYRPAA